MPEEQQHSLREGLEVVVPIDLGPVHQGDLSEHLQTTQGGPLTGSPEWPAAASPAPFPRSDLKPRRSDCV